MRTEQITRTATADEITYSIETTTTREDTIMTTKTPNVAFIPTHNDGLYDEPGIDLLHDADIDVPDEDRDSDAEHVEWVPVGQWGEPDDETGAPWEAIKEALAARGLRMVGSLDTWSASYAIARLERI